MENVTQHPVMHPGYKGALSSNRASDQKCFPQSNPCGTCRNQPYLDVLGNLKRLQGLQNINQHEPLTPDRLNYDILRDETHIDVCKWV